MRSGSWTLDSGTAFDSWGGLFRPGDGGTEFSVKSKI
ncbi:hypothetical protein vBCbaSRXM_141 [Citromicrobium phage vB_CbaS-RXM]|nr:hypothetical protein vBCbaSRXM_141 [Citromicrobium phage vB_CbaS-RXM]